MIVTKIWPDNMLNGMAILDGIDLLWVVRAFMNPGIPAGKAEHVPGQWQIRPRRFVQ